MNIFLTISTNITTNFTNLQV